MVQLSSVQPTLFQGQQELGTTGALEKSQGLEKFFLSTAHIPHLHHKLV